jgi:thymidine phosphorylase
LSEVGIGDEVKRGDALGVLYCRRNDEATEAAMRLCDAYHIDETRRMSAQTLIKEVITE